MVLVLPADVGMGGVKVGDAAGLVPAGAVGTVPAAGNWPGAAPLTPSTQNGLKALYWLEVTIIRQRQRRQHGHHHAAASCTANPRPITLNKAQARSLFMASILLGPERTVPASS